LNNYCECQKEENSK